MPAHRCLKFVLPFLACFTLMGHSSLSKADSPDYPNRAVKLTVPCPPGGGTDITARAMAQQLNTIMKQSVVIENRPGTVTYGSIGAGSPQHLAGELLASGARASLVHVPYKGSGPLVQDTMGGVVDIGISSLPPAINLIKAGKLRALSVTSAARVPSLPDVPTMQELGYQGYEFNTWVGVAVPVGTPQDIILKINQSMRTALASDEIKKIFLE